MLTSLNSAAKVCIIWYLVLLISYAFFIWRKYHLSQRPILLNPYVFIPTLLALTSVITSLLGINFTILALEFSVGIIFGFIHPAFLTGFFVVSLLIKPWEIIAASNEIEILPRTLAILCICSSILYFLRIKKLKFSIYPAFISFLAFYSWTLISAAVASNSSESLGQYFSLCLPLIIIFILLNFVTEDRNDWYILVTSLIVGILALTTNAVTTTLWDWNYSISQIPRLQGQGHWSNANDLAALMVLGLPFVLFTLSFRSKNTIKLILGAAALSILLLGIWLSQSRATILAILCGSAGFIFINKKFSIFSISIVLSCALISFVFLSSISREQSDLEGSSSMRLEYIYTGFRMLVANPVAGVGFENYDNYFELYTTKFDEYGRRTAHSSWVLAMAESGIIGLGLFLLFCYQVLKSAYKLRLILPELFIACISYGVCMSFLSHTYQLPLYILASLVINADKIFNKKNV